MQRAFVDRPPFRVEHIGSLLRPSSLIRAREAFERQQITPAELREIEDHSIVDAMRFQEGIGLRSITDGEFRRKTYFDDFVGRLNGISLNMPLSMFEGGGSEASPSDSATSAGSTSYSARLPPVSVAGIVGWSGPIMRADFDFVARHTSQVAKVTIPAPTQIYHFAGRAGISREAYPDVEQFWSDVVAAYRRELSDLAAAGCRFVQIDETCLAKLCDPTVRDRMKERGDDWQALIATYARCLNDICRNLPLGLHLGIHLCRGNFQGRWEAEGGYENVADIIFNGIAAETYFLEFDSPRAGSLDVLRHVPAGKLVVLGLVSTKASAVETTDHIKRRVDEAARYVPLERLAISPQCGFAGVFKGHPLSVEDQRRKLEVLVKAANEIWGVA